MAQSCTTCAADATATCSVCRQPLCTKHTERWHPLITARQLAVTTVSTATRAPSMLGEVLLKPLDQVDYCTDCRDGVAERRQTEQLKLAVVMFVMFALVGGCVWLLLSQFGIF